MFEKIPSNVLDVLENNDLLVYSCGVTLSRHGPVLHIGAMFPYKKNRWEPLDEEENLDLRVDVKKELRDLGYRSKVRSFVHKGVKDVNDFRIKILLTEGEGIDEAQVEKLRQIHRAMKQAAQRVRLSSQL